MQTSRSMRWLRGLTLALFAVLASGCFATSRVLEATGGHGKGPRNSWRLEEAFLLEDGSVLLYGRERRLLSPYPWGAQYSWVVQISPEQMARSEGDGDLARIAVSSEQWEVAVEAHRVVALPPHDAPPGAAPDPERAKACSFVGSMRRLTRPLWVGDSEGGDPHGGPSVIRLRDRIVPEGDAAQSSPAQLRLRGISIAGSDGETSDDLGVAFPASVRAPAPLYLLLLPGSLALDTYYAAFLVTLGPPLLLASAIAGEPEDPEEARILEEARETGCSCVATYNPAPFQTVRGCYRPGWW